MSEQVFNVNCGFFHSINHDRVYSAEDMNKPYKRIISNGIFATPKGTPSTDFQVVSANDGMNVIVKKGEGLIADKWFENPSDLIITVSTNTHIVLRLDSIILQVNKLQNGRSGNVVYREGSPSSNPVPPPINQDENITEMRVANILVSPTANKIGQDVITDLRGSEECPWSTHLIQQVDTSQLYKQWQEAYKKYYDDEIEAFNLFMENLTEQLTVNMGIIQRESHFITTDNNTTEIPINITNYNKNKDILFVTINRMLATQNIDYSISSDSTKIILTKDLEANQKVSFLMFKSVVAGGAETVLTEINRLNEKCEKLQKEIVNEWIEADLADGIKATTNGYGGYSGIRYKKIGSRVYVQGSVSFTVLNDSLELATIPTGYRPQKINYKLVSAAGHTVARLLVDPEGKIRVDWCINISDGSSVTGEIEWLDVSIDFPID